ncbi:hypothetical protein [Dankookia sp. P2]|uniref:hypothetical protein n=1 Tax=Dankookia sp. P2 TaxID=3423955 RepID=UPI003D673233
MVEGDRPPALTCAAEAAALALLGGVLAPLVVLLFHWLMGATEGATHALAWAFLLWAGPVDLIARIITGHWLVTMPGLLFAATLVGAPHQHDERAVAHPDWKGGGWIGFPLDVTWGLAGNVNGLLLHLVNQVIADRHAYTSHGTRRIATSAASASSPGSASPRAAS